MYMIGLSRLEKKVRPTFTARRRTRAFPKATSPSYIHIVLDPPGKMSSFPDFGLAAPGLHFCNVNNKYIYVCTYKKFLRSTYIGIYIYVHLWSYYSQFYHRNVITYEIISYIRPSASCNSPRILYPVSRSITKSCAFMCLPLTPIIFPQFCHFQRLSGPKRSAIPWVWLPFTD